MRHSTKKMLLVLPKPYAVDLNEMGHVRRRLGVPGGIMNASLPTVAALTPKEVAVRIVDETVEPIDFDEPVDLVGIGGFHSSIKRAGEIAREFSRRGVLVAAGGPSVCLSPERWRPLADVLIMGEAERIWPQFMADYLAGRHLPEYRETGAVDLGLTPLPDFSAISPAARKLYWAGIVQTSRGCPFDCEFCDTIVYVGRRPRYKPVENIILELDQLQRLGFRSVFLADDNFGANRAKAKQILSALGEWNHRQRRSMHFATQISIDAANDEELLALLANAGLTLAFVGIETPNRDALSEASKTQNLRNDLAENIKAFHEHGIMVWGGLMVGFDSDDASIFQRQYDLFQTAGVSQVSFNMLHAPDGTPLKARMIRENRYLDQVNRDSLEGLNFGVPEVIPSHMTFDQLFDGAVWLMWQLTTPQNTMDRVKKFLQDYENSARKKALDIPRFQVRLQELKPKRTKSAIRSLVPGPFAGVIPTGFRPSIVVGTKRVA
ncbi:MAG: radical SAM protein [Thermoguttaceae bacterium]